MVPPPGDDPASEHPEPSAPEKSGHDAAPTGSAESAETSPSAEPGEPASGFGKALEEFERGGRTTRRPRRAAGPPRRGARVRGKVTAFTAEHALIDIGGRSEATAELGPFRNEDGTLQIQVGDTVDLYVVESAEQIVLATAAPVAARAGVERLREAKAAGMPVQGRVTGANSGGLLVELGGARGFCPISQVEIGHCSDASIYRGRTLEFMVTSVEEGKRNVVLSRRQLLRKQEQQDARRRLASLRPGDEVDGTVRRLEAFGAFVDLGGVDGMVHVSEIQHARVGHPRDVLQEGQEVKVRVLRIDTGKDGRPRIALSMKASVSDPWNGIDERYQVGMRVQGTVARLAEFGAFVTLEPGVDGLVHVSEIAPHRVAQVQDALAVGQTVEANVLAVDPAKKRIALSIRAAAGEIPAPEPVRRRDESSSRRSDAPEELTTMAIALRQAEERARRKRDPR